jgi:hypothetical protein
MALTFDLENLNPGKWFDFGDDGGVCLRVAPNAKIREFTRKAEKKGKVDGDLFDRLLWAYCIVDWRGIVDAAGEPIECTDENKAILMGGAPDFSGYITEKLGELREAKLSERELEKN